jgi:hypothetical protein
MTLQLLYKKYLEDNPNTYCTYEQWLEFMSNNSRDIDPIVSDDFQIGPDGAFEYQDNETTWDDIFNDIENKLHSELPIRVKNWLKNKFNPPIQIN